MSEQHIRSVLREVCDELDRCARKVLFPSLIGAGIALAGGCDSRPVSTDGKVTAEASPLYAAPLDGRARENPPLPPYGVPFDRGVRDQRQARENPPMPPYMAPDVGPPQPDYMAPDPDAKPPPPKLDGGPQPLYLAPPFPPDAK